VGEGGGTDGENITVHRVALGELPAFVAACRQRGLAVDTKLLVVLAPHILAG
jgi:ADP-ribose pyrophosphatase